MTELKTLKDMVKDLGYEPSMWEIREHAILWVKKSRKIIKEGKFELPREYLFMKMNNISEEDLNENSE